MVRLLNRAAALAILVVSFVALGPYRASAQMLGLWDNTVTTTTWAHPSGDGGGGIFKGTVRHTASGKFLPTTGFLVCDGDRRYVYLNTAHATYSWVRILDVSDYHANNYETNPAGPFSLNWPNKTPGKYTGYTVPYRNADVRARTAWLVDQMAAAGAGPNQNKDWALQWAIWTTWSGYTLPSGLQPATVTWYNTWLTQAASINAANYTHSDAIWLVALGPDNTRYQNLFTTMVPEPALVQLPGLLLMSGLGVGLHRLRRKA